MSAWTNSKVKKANSMPACEPKDFWQFSLRVYAVPEVQHTLLQWQDEHQLNVNVCLLMLYLDKQQLALDSSQVTALENAISHLDTQAIKPMRSSRKYFKSQWQSLPDYAEIRSQFLALELALEKLQQNLLVQTLNTLSLEQKTQPNNLLQYLPPELQPLPTDLDQLLHQVS